MMEPRSRNDLRRAFAPILTLLLLVSLAGTAVIAYSAGEPVLDWSASPPPKLRDKALEMLKKRTLSTSLTEAEVNALVKQELYANRELNGYVQLSGADVRLDNDLLIVRTDVRMGSLLRLPITHKLHLEWNHPELTATHLSSSLKEIPLPSSWMPIGVIRVPLNMDDRIPAELVETLFEENEIRFRFQLKPLF